MATNQKPIHHIFEGSVKASIWEQFSSNGSFLSVSFSRSYKNKQGQWQNDHSYTEANLKVQINCAIEALEWMKAHSQQSGKVA